MPTTLLLDAIAKHELIFVNGLRSLINFLLNKFLTKQTLKLRIPLTKYISINSPFFFYKKKNNKKQHNMM